jgi:hypothetical protein
MEKFHINHFQSYILVLCVFLCLPLSISSEENEPVKIEEEKCSDPLTWKKILLYSGVCIVGLVTFSLVGTGKSK